MNTKPTKTTYDKIAIGSLFSFHDQTRPFFRKIMHGYSCVIEDENDIALDYKPWEKPSDITVYYFGTEVLAPKNT